MAESRPVPVQPYRHDDGLNIRRINPNQVKAGEYADVWIGIWTTTVNGREEEKRVAIKALRGAPAYNTKAIDKLNKKLAEAVARYKNIKHKNVIEVCGISQSFGYLPAVILQVCENGNVVEYLKNFAEGEAKQEKRRKLIRESSRGLEHLHSCNVVHGDIRAANILVTADGTPVISDFGLAFIIDQTEFTSAKIAGSARWSPPEVLDPPDDDEDGEDDGGADRPGSKCKGSDGDDLAVPPYSKKSDVYSMGMAFYEIATGERPFYERRSDSAVIFKIVKGERPDLPALLSDNPIVKDLMARCWEASPTDRPTAAEMCVILEKEFPPAQEEIVGWGLGLGLGAYAQAIVQWVRDGVSYATGWWG